MKKQVVSFCFIESFPSLKEGIFSLSDITKSQLKKLNLPKNFLDKSIRAKDEISLEIDILNFGKISSEYKGSVPAILHEDENVIVLSKPHRIHCHPLRYNEGDNLLSFLRQYDSELLSVNEKSYDRGLLYRLDFETSGLIYYIKNQSLYDKLRDSFSELVKTKYYYALVDGIVEKAMTITHSLDTSGNRGAIVKESESGKKCTIEIEVIEQFNNKNRTMLKINLHEGFKHQIRAQLNLSGFPIVGDPIYGKTQANRLYLHCYQYKIELDDKEYSIEDKKGLELFFRNANCES